MTRLVLVRHGEAQSFVDGVIGGAVGCTGLSALGRRQADALRARLERTGELRHAGAVYASTLPRAIQTAEAIAPALGDGHQLQTSCDLCEVHVDERLDAHSWEDVPPSTEWPPVTNPYQPWADGAEPWADFTLRVGRELDRLVRAHAGDTVVVACHGGVVAAAATIFGDLPLRSRLRLQVDNTSLTEWRLDADATDARHWTLVRFNDAAHLEGVR